MYINTNLVSLTAQLNLSRSQSALAQAIERLSSGKRINSAKDDAAGLGISNRFTANIRGLNQALRNTNDGISLIQTTLGALDEVNNNLQRIRELSVQAANGTNSQADLDSIQAEIDQRLAEIGRISSQTSFNGIKTLNEDKKLRLQVGANDGDYIELDLSKTNLETLGLEIYNVNGSELDKSKIKDIDDAINQIDILRGELGAMHNRLESVTNTINTTALNLTAARSRIEDADYAMEVSNMIRAQILQQVGINMLMQANQIPNTVLSLLRF